MAGTWGNTTIPIRQQNSHILIENPNLIAGKQASITDGRLSGSGDNPPGYINPINIRTTSQLMNIDSCYRSNYYNSSSSKFRINLPDPQRKVVKLKLSSLEIPLTYYAISSKKGNASMLVLTKNKNDDGDTAGDTAWRVRLADGNYEFAYSDESSALNIEQAMNNALALAEPGKLNENNQWISDTSTSLEGPLTKYVRYVVDHASGRSTFAYADTPGEDCTVVPDQVKGVRFNVTHEGNIDTNMNIQKRLGWQLGFRAAAYDAKAITSEAPCCIHGPKYGFIAINDFQNNVSPTYIVSFSESTLDSNIIGRINLASQIYDNTIYKLSKCDALSDPDYAIREYFGPVNIQKLEFTLYDDVGNILDLNNCDWSCSLVFEKQYE